MIPFDDALDGCLQALATGELTPEQCLARYPEHAAELRPLLLAAARVAAAPSVRPSPEFAARARRQLEAHMRTRPRSARSTRGRLVLAQVRRAGLALAGGLVAFAVVGTALAQTALPGEALYPLKRASESAWAAVQPDAASRLEAELAFAQRRLAEAEAVAGDLARLDDAIEAYNRSRLAIAELVERYPALRARADAALDAHAERLQALGVHEQASPVPTLEPSPEVTLPVPLPTAAPPVLVVPTVTPIAPDVIPPLPTLLP